MQVEMQRGLGARCGGAVDVVGQEDDGRARLHSESACHVDAHGGHLAAGKPWATRGGPGMGGGNAPAALQPERPCRRPRLDRETQSLEHMTGHPQRERRDGPVEQEVREVGQHGGAPAFRGYRRGYLPQLSFRPVARLNTGLPGAWSSRSATKYPNRSNWNLSSGCAPASEGST